MLDEEFRSKRPLSMISLDMNTTSRSTANKWSFKPRIITPSTNAAAGAFLISSLMPQAWRTMRKSKSRYFSKMTRASSISLPELRTANAHLRNNGYKPPWPESSSLAISCWERCSKLPLGPPAHRPCQTIESRLPRSTFFRGRYRSEYCPACASTLRPCRSSRELCSRRSSRSTHNTPKDGAASWGNHGS